MARRRLYRRGPSGFTVARKPFGFSTIGQLASIGYRTGVAEVLGMRLSGFVAWWLWRGAYLSKLPETSKKVAINRSLDLLFAREIEQLVTLRDIEGMEKLAATLRTMREHLHNPERAGAGILIIRNPTRIPDEHSAGMAFAG